MRRGLGLSLTARDEMGLGGYNWALMIRCSQEF